MSSVNGNTNNGELKIEALKLCKEFLGGPWKDLSLENFKLSTVSGGLSNSLYHCALPEESRTDCSNVPREVLLRIYGPVQDDVSIVLSESAIFLLLSERSLGPKLYGVFPKGRLEEYVPSRSLKRADIRRFSTIIAEEMAKIHTLEVPISKVPDICPVFMNKWLKDVKEDTSKFDAETIDQLNMYRTEIDWITQEMEKQSSPIGFCHNDLQGGNILLREDSAESGEPEIMLIDFEFGGYNYMTFDIANHFCEWCFDYNTEKYPFFDFDFNKFPNREEQVQYLTSYLNQLKKSGVKVKNFVTELNTIINEISFFAMVCNLMWSLWSIKMCQTSSMDFAHKEHGRIRRKLYFTFKEKYLELYNCRSKEN